MHKGHIIAMLPCQYRCPMMRQRLMEERSRSLNEEIASSRYETLYPKIYYIIYPYVQRYCDILQRNNGTVYDYTENDLDSMVKYIIKDCSRELEDKWDSDDGERDSENSFKGMTKSLVRILLIRELLSRRAAMKI